MNSGKNLTTGKPVVLNLKTTRGKFSHASSAGSRGGQVGGILASGASKLIKE